MGERSKLRNSATISRIVGASFSGALCDTVMRRKIATPDWFADKKKVKKFLTDRFYWAFDMFDRKCSCERCQNPSAQLRATACKCRPCRETMMALKWLIVIQEWFVNRVNDGTVEAQHNWKPGTVGTIVRNIRRVLAGRPQDGSLRTGRPRGRPKNSCPLVNA